jgi:hypothetical protein
MHPRRLTVVPTLVAILAVAACNSAAGSAAPGSSTAATPGATATEQPAASQPGTASAAPGASVDVSGSAAALAALSSYKVTMQIAGSSTASVETIVINGATPAKQVTETSGSEVIRIIEIGEDVWLDQGTGTFVKNAIPKSSADAMLSAFDLSTMLVSMQRQPEIAFLQNMGTEQKNGQNAVHLHADQNTPLPAGSSPIPAGTLFDMWVAADGGYLVALEASGLAATGSTTDSIQIELTNVNDPALKVEAPA